MQKILSAEKMREVDRLTTEKYGIPSIILMENAAHAAARVIAGKLGGSLNSKSFLILCGKGNNGGDGAALARILWMQRAKVRVCLFGAVADTKADARVNFEIVRNLAGLDNADSDNLNFEEVPLFSDWAKSASLEGGRYDVLVDALFGTGLTRPLDAEYAPVVRLFSKAKAPLVFSLDLPSGLDADSAEPIGDNVRADLTVTFTAPKPANVFPGASECSGELWIANIGSAQELIDNAPSKLFLAETRDARDWLRQTAFSDDSYKNKRGHAFLIVGSRGYTGAAVLAGNAAMVSGAGLTTIATSASAQPIIAERVLEEVITRALPETENGTIAEKAYPEIEKLAMKADVVGIGCGLGTAFGESPDNQGAVDQRDDVPRLSGGLLQLIVQNRRTPIIIDADGLNALSPFDLQGSDEFPLILTPHEGELLRLLGTTEKSDIADRAKAVRDFSERHHVILVLKGERVLIGAPGGRVVVNPTGNSGVGKAGNGDTLTGIITGFIAQAVKLNVDIFETVVAAVYCAGAAGDIAARKFGKRAMLASDVRDCLAEAFEEIENRKSS